MEGIGNMALDAGGASEVLVALRLASQSSPSSQPSLPDGELLRFYGEAPNLGRAEGAIRAAVVWREQHRHLLRTTSSSELDDKVMACVSHIGTDVNGLPFICVDPGTVLEASDDGVNTQLLLDGVARGFEALRRKLRNRSADRMGLTLLLDLRSVRLSFLLLTKMPMLREIVQTFESFYPACLRCVLVDCTEASEQHLLLPQPWTLFRPLLAESTRARCVVVSDAAALLPIIHEHAPTISPSSPTGLRAIRSRLHFLLGKQRPPRSQLVRRGIILPSEPIPFAGVSAREEKAAATLRVIIEEDAAASPSAPISPQSAPSVAASPEARDATIARLSDSRLHSDHAMSPSPVDPSPLRETRAVLTNGTPRAVSRPQAVPAVRAADSASHIEGSPRGAGSLSLGDATLREDISPNGSSPSPVASPLVQCVSLPPVPSKELSVPLRVLSTMTDLECIWWLRFYGDGDGAEAGDLTRVARALQATLLWRWESAIDQILYEPLHATARGTDKLTVAAEDDDATATAARPVPDTRTYVEPTSPQSPRSRVGEPSHHAGSSPYAEAADEGMQHNAVGEPASPLQTQERLVTLLLGSFKRCGSDLVGQPFFVFSAPCVDLQAMCDQFGHQTLCRFGLRCFEHVRMAMLDESYRTGSPTQNLTLLMDLGGWADQLRPASPVLPVLLRLLKELSMAWRNHYPHRVKPIIVTRLPALSALWSFVRPFLSESLRTRLEIVQSDAALLPTLTERVPIAVVPLHLRQRSLSAQLSSRQSREDVVKRGLLAATSAHAQSGYDVVQATAPVPPGVSITPATGAFASVRKLLSDWISPETPGDAPIVGDLAVDGPPVDGDSDTASSQTARPHSVVHDVGRDSTAPLAHSEAHWPAMLSMGVSPHFRTDSATVSSGGEARRRNSLQSSNESFEHNCDSSSMYSSARLSEQHPSVGASTPLAERALGQKSAQFPASQFSPPQDLDAVVGPRMPSIFSLLLGLVLFLAWLIGDGAISCVWLIPLWLITCECHRLSLRQLVLRTVAGLQQESAREKTITRRSDRAAHLSTVPSPPATDWQPDTPAVFHSATYPPIRSNASAGTAVATSLPVHERRMPATPQWESGNDGHEHTCVVDRSLERPCATSEDGLLKAGQAYTWERPACFNEIWRRVWMQAAPDFSRRLQRKIDKVLASRLSGEGFGTVRARIDVGALPFTFDRIRLDGADPKHIRLEAELEWRGAASVELTFATTHFSLPLMLSDFSICGPVRMQTTPQHYAPYLGHCAISFTQPPTIDFTLRALRSFDVMEVPVLSQRLQDAFRDKVFAPMVWPRQAFFLWSDLVDSPIPYRVTIRIASLQPPLPIDKHGGANTVRLASTDTPQLDQTVQLAVTLSEKQYDQNYVTADVFVPQLQSASTTASSAKNEIAMCEEITFVLEAPHLLPRLRLELRRKRTQATSSDQQWSALCRAEVPIHEMAGCGFTKVALGGGWHARVSLSIQDPPPSQDARADAVLHVSHVSALPSQLLQRRGDGLIQLQLQAGTWVADAGSSAAAEWAPAAMFLLPRPDAQPLRATLRMTNPVTGQEEIGTATLALDKLAVGSKPTVLWAPIQPNDECVLRVECALLDSMSAAWRGLASSVQLSGWER